MTNELHEVLQRFDSLPDDAILPSRVTGIILGVSERTVRYHPQLPIAELLALLGAVGLTKDLIPRFNQSKCRIVICSLDYLSHPFRNYPAANCTGPNHHHKGVFIACPVRRFVILGAFLYSFGRPFHDTTPA